MYKLAILTSHPIQYQAPLFKKISECPEIDLTVYFKKKMGVTASYHDKEFKKMVKWDVPLLEGYSFKFLSAPFDLMIELQTFSYDAMMLYGWNSWTNIFAYTLARLKKIKILMYGENPMNQEKKKSGLLQIIKKTILRFLFGHASAILFIGKENRKFYEWLGVSERKLFYMPYAVDNDRWRSELKKLRKHSREKPVILFVGKLIAKKRPLDLIRAFAPFDEMGELVMVGEGELRKKLELYVRCEGIQNVRFAGFVSQKNLPEYYGGSDIFVLPSGIGETWGLVVNEAMNFSLPVIVSDFAGCAEDLVIHGKNGFVYSTGNVEELRRYIGMLLESEDVRASFGRKSHDIIQDFSYAKDVRGLQEALSSSRDS